MERLGIKVVINSLLKSMYVVEKSNKGKYFKKSKECEIEK